MWEISEFPIRYKDLNNGEVRNAKKQNGCLRNSCEMKRSEKQRKKGKIYAFECRVPKNSKQR